VNPTLLVLGRRDDGYHEVDTTLIAIDLCDTVTVRVERDDRAGLEVEVTGPMATEDVPRDARNLAVRALLAARETLVSSFSSVSSESSVWGGLARASLTLRLEKHIPSQAGLGGGSSDAAAAVAAFEAAAGLCLAADQRLALLAGLGADCAFFAAAAATGAGRATGIGAEVTALEAPTGWHLVVATPEVRCPTGPVYGALVAPYTPPAHPADPSELLRLPAHAAGPLLQNHLERAALTAVPALVPWRSLLDTLEAERGVPFHLSGSGSSWFALVDDAREAEALRARLVDISAARGLALRATWCARPLSSIPASRGAG